MKKTEQENKQYPNKANKSQKQHKEVWLGHPDDHEPTKEVKKEDLKP